MNKPNNQWKTLLRDRGIWGIERPEVYLERMAAVFSCTIPGLFHRIAHLGVKIVIRVIFPSPQVENIARVRSNAECGLLSNCGIM